MPSSGRIVHSTTMPLSAVSVQLHPSMSVVCTAARVSVSTGDGSLLRLTAATPKSTFTGCGHSWGACTLCSVVPTYTAVAPSVTAYRLSVSPTGMLRFEPANSAPEITDGSSPRSCCWDASPHVLTGAPVSAPSTTTSATSSQLSSARPRLFSAAPRCCITGSRSGVHCSTWNALSLALAQRIDVTCGATSTRCSPALTRKCTPSATFTSVSG